MTVANVSKRKPSNLVAACLSRISNMHRRRPCLSRPLVRLSGYLECPRQDLVSLLAIKISKLSWGEECSFVQQRFYSGKSGHNRHDVNG